MGYEADPRLVFRGDDHVYSVEGVRVRSVTQVMKDAGLGVGDVWDQEALDLAADRGTAVHAVAEYWDKGTLDMASVSGPLASYLTQWKSFRSTTGFRPRLVEARRWDEGLWVATTVDRTGFFPGESEECIVEIKSKAQMTKCDPKWGIQTAGQGIILGKPRWKRYAVVLSPEEWRCYPLENRNDDGIFRAALALSKWKTNNGY